MPLDPRALEELKEIQKQFQELRETFLGREVWPPKEPESPRSVSWWRRGLPTLWRALSIFRATHPFGYALQIVLLSFRLEVTIFPLLIGIRTPLLSIELMVGVGDWKRPGYETGVRLCLIPNLRAYRVRGRGQRLYIWELPLVWFVPRRKR